MKRLELDKLDVARAFLIVGKKGSGKTTTLISLLCGLAPKIDFIFAMCGSVSGLKSLRRAVPAEVLYDGLDMTRFEHIIDTLGRITAANEDFSRITASILDDVSFQKQFFKSVSIRKCVMNGRWLRLALFITQQYLMDVGPEIRSQIDYVFALAEPSQTVRRRLWTYYFDIFPKFPEFEQVFMGVTQKKGRALVIDLTNTSTTVLQERIFYFESEVGLEEKLILGSQHFREIIARERERQIRRRNVPNQNADNTDTLTV